MGEDPESRKVVENEIILDPGSDLASVFAEASPDRPRDLAGMTNYDTASQGGGDSCEVERKMPRSVGGVLHFYSTIILRRDALRLKQGSGTRCISGWVYRQNLKRKRRGIS